jgi:ATP-dependent DNA helicase RecQ
LDLRKAAEYEKLESVIRFARTNHCRQQVILEYFGERNGAKCGQCDRCAPMGATIATAGNLDVNPSDHRAATLSEVDQRDLLRGIQVILSGVTRMHGRFGKQLVAQMLCGSTNKKLQQWKLHRLSTYGLLSSLRQSDVSEVMDCLIESALLEQREVDQHRPTLDITEFGREVMLCKCPLPDSLKIKTPLARRLARALREIESNEVNPANAHSPSNSNSPANSSESAGPQPTAGEATPQSTALEDQLKRWRRKTSAAMGIPIYRVLTNATIERIATTLPQNLEQLSAINGVGPATIQQYGADLLAFTTGVSLQALEAGPAVGAVLSDRDVADRDVADRVVVDTDWQATDAYWTWRLFHDGYSAEQIGRIRGRDRESLIGDLQQASESGQPVDPTWIRSDTSQQKSSPDLDQAPQGG